MRVLVATNMYPGPGAPDYGAFVEEMAAALGRRGLDVRVAAIATRRNGALATPAKYARLLGDTVRLARGCDVVYAHYLFPTGAIAAAAGRAAGRPWVVTAHGRDVRNLDRPLVRRATAAALRGASAVVCVSRYLEGELRASGIRLPPVTVAHMGVDLDRFRPSPRADARARLGLPADGPLVLAVGGLTPRKNPLGLLQAFARLLRARPDARLALVGDGPLAGAVAAGAARLGVADRVLRPGALPHAAVADWMAAADVLALPSAVEPLGVVALEALASGRPVVATNRGGAPEVVPATGVGRIVDPRDPVRLAAALADILARAPTPESCRAAAAPHSLDRQAATVERVLREAAGTPATG